VRINAIVLAPVYLNRLSDFENCTYPVRSGFLLVPTGTSDEITSPDTPDDILIANNFQEIAIDIKHYYDKSGIPYKLVKFFHEGDADADQFSMSLDQPV